LTIYDLLSLIVALSGWLFAGTAQYSLVRRVRTGEEKWANGGPSRKLQVHVESEIRDIRLRVEKNEAHWEAMYAKFDRLQRSSKQRVARDRPSEEVASEAVPTVELTVEEQKLELRRKMRSRRGN